MRSILISSAFLHTKFTHKILHRLFQTVSVLKAMMLVLCSGLRKAWRLVMASQGAQYIQAWQALPMHTCTCMRLWLQRQQAERKAIHKHCRCL